jgi:alanine racemase
VDEAGYRDASLGVRPEQAEAFYQRLSQCKNVRQPVNIVSHFARADEPECGATERQLDIFTTFTEGKPGLRSIAASGGICCGRSRTSTGRVRGLFSTACRRWTVDPPARILAASR